MRELNVNEIEQINGGRLNEISQLKSVWATWVQQAILNWRRNKVYV
mgnify:CR=1 FL=1